MKPHEVLDLAANRVEGGFFGYGCNFIDEIASTTRCHTETMAYFGLFEPTEDDIDDMGGYYDERCTGWFGCGNNEVSRDHRITALRLAADMAFVAGD